MTDGDPRKALDALASEHGLPILRFLRDRDWTLASQVAGGLGIHTTTASKYLAAFHAAGLLDRRAYASRRPTYAYRLKSAVVRLEFDLAGTAEPSDLAEAGQAFLKALMDAAYRVGGPRLARGIVFSLFQTEDWGGPLARRLTASGKSRVALDLLLTDARRACTDLVGATAAGRLMRIALDTAAEGRADLFPAEVRR